MMTVYRYNIEMKSLSIVKIGIALHLTIERLANKKSYAAVVFCFPHKKNRREDSLAEPVAC